MLIRKRQGWEIPEREVTDEDVYWNRREILRGLGLAGAGVGLGALLGGRSRAEAAVAGAGGDGGAGGTAGGLPARPSRRLGQGGVTPVPEAVRYPDWPAAGLYPAERSPRFGVEDAGRPITDEAITLAYNNFYEFFPPKDGVWKLAEKFETRPWELEVGGLVDEPGSYDLDALIREMPLEERVYRFRCVEAWAATIPWTGFPFKALIDKVKPQDGARYVRMQTVMRPGQMPGIAEQEWYPWPYTEGLTMEEALNELTLLVTGIYGKPLAKQNGAPIRLIVPWKFGFKSVKSIQRIDFVAEQPDTLWSTVTPAEYSFWANINPEVDHPRWSQARETLISTGEKVPTRKFNGYGEWVAHLYEGLEDELGIWLYR